MISKKGRKDLLSTNRKASYPYLIHISNEDLGEFYFANFHKDVEYNGHVYKRSFFELNPPDKSQERIGNASFSFSVADGEWIKKVRETQKRSKLEFVAIILYEDDTIEPIEENKFVLTSATWDESTLTWQMVFDENMDILIPCDIMNGLTVPACL